MNRTCPKIWDESLWQVQMLLIGSEAEPQGATPAERLYGKNIRLPVDFGLPQELVSAIDGDAVRLDLDALSIAPRDAAAQAAKERSDKTRDLIEYEVGNLVWLKNMVRIGKHAARQLGPFKIVQKLSPLLYKIAGIQGGRAIGRLHNVVNIVQLQLYKGTEDDVREQRGDGSEEVVEEVVSHVIDLDDELWFEVRWAGGEVTEVPWYNMVDIGADSVYTLNDALDVYLRDEENKDVRQRVRDRVTGVRVAQHQTGDDADD
jgi:hypothetical protein